MRRWLRTSRWPRLLGISLAAAVLAAFLAFSAGHRYRIKKNYAAAEKSWEESNYQRAIELYQTVIDDYPNHPLAGQAQFQIGRTYFLFLQKEREAIRTFREMIRRNPTDRWSFKAQAELGEIFEDRLEDYRQAIVEYQRFINVSSPEDKKDEAQLAVARCYFKLGDFDQAREEYEIHLEKYPESPLRDRALVGLANSYYVRRAYQSAISNYRKAIIESDDAALRSDAAFSIASSLEESGDVKGALEEFEKIRGEYPNPDLVEQRIERIRGMLDEQTPEKKSSGSSGG